MIALVTDAYATTDDYRQAIDKQDLDADPVIEVDLMAISRWLDKRLDRFFGQEGSDLAPVTREYEIPLSSTAPRLPIDDLVTLTSIGIDTDGDGSINVVLSAAEYRLFPLNARLGSEPHPYDRIALFPGGVAGSTNDVIAGIGAFPPVLRIAGVWGWPAVPEAIKRATIQLTALWRLDTPRATTQISELGTTSGVGKRAMSIVDEVPRVYARRWWVR